MKNIPIEVCAREKRPVRLGRLRMVTRGVVLLFLAAFFFSSAISLARGDDLTPIGKLQAAAERGDPKAQSALGYAYNAGEGVEQDYQKAAFWYEQAARRGNRTAQINLAGMYSRGKVYPQDKSFALFITNIARKDYPRCPLLRGLREDLIQQMSPAEVARIDQASGAQ